MKPKQMNKDMMNNNTQNTPGGVCAALRLETRRYLSHISLATSSNTGPQEHIIVVPGSSVTGMYIYIYMYKYFTET